MDMSVRARVLVEMDHLRTVVRMSHGDACLLERLPDRSALGILARLDVSSRLEPATDATMQMEQHATMAFVEHDRRCGHVRRQRAPDERIIRRSEELAQVRDGVLLELVKGGVGSEASEELGAARIVDARAQVRISFASTAPVLSRS